MRKLTSKPAIILLLYLAQLAGCLAAKNHAIETQVISKTERFTVRRAMPGWYLPAFGLIGFSPEGFFALYYENSEGSHLIRGNLDMAEDAGVGRLELKQVDGRHWEVTNPWRGGAMSIVRD